MNITKETEKKRVLIGMLTFIIYLVASYSEAIPLVLLKIDIDKLSTAFKSTYVIIYQIILFVLLCIPYRKYLKEKLIDLKQNHKLYFKKYFKYWILMLVLMMISNLIISLIIPNAMPTNEENVREILKANPIYMYISAVMIAPFLEELVFRLGFRYIFKTNIVFIIMSGLSFGAMHVVTSSTTLIELLYIIPYSIPGFVFAYLITKTNNIYTSMGLHLLHNGVLTSLQILLMFLA